MNTFLLSVIPIATLLLQIVIVLVALAWISGYWLPSLRNFVKKIFSHGMLFAWAITGLSIAMSLFYSSIIGFEPCALCWWQRVYLYPNFFLLGYALIKKERTIVRYSLILLGVGLLYALYHLFIYYGGSPLVACGADAEACVRRYVWEYGFMTIPLMSATGFIATMGSLFLYQKSGK